jgi:hypothetical protein
VETDPSTGDDDDETSRIVSESSSNLANTLGPDVLADHAKWANKYKSIKAYTNDRSEQITENPINSILQWNAYGRKPKIIGTNTSDTAYGDLTSAEINEWNTSRKNAGYTANR